MMNNNFGMPNMNNNFGMNMMNNNFPQNFTGAKEFYKGLFKIDEKYFILTSTKHSKYPDKIIQNKFYISLYNFNTLEEITKMELDEIINLNEGNEGNINNKFSIVKDDQTNNKFKIIIKCNNQIKNYKILFLEGQLLLEN